VEARYNRYHVRARNIIERTFGMLKMRWRSIFLSALEIRPLFAPKVIGACCVLHNICVAAGDILEEEEEEEEEEEGPVPDDNEEDTGHADDRDLSGNGVRGRLAAQMSAPKNCLHVWLNMTISQHSQSNLYSQVIVFFVCCYVLFCLNN